MNAARLGSGGLRDDGKDGGLAAFPGREVTAKVEAAAVEPMVKATRLDGYGSDGERQPGGMAAEYLLDTEKLGVAAAKLRVS
ncbi:hypothetical protein E2562_022812 [Oryza meyeriana var. granulata]|uniref:Uncharacterized protein n=1 Tax=Oryza meyeriana var. granulata TaxID=110450 RepID=A0A6G1FBG5_9ORYZ|nr:hypothetical protein E2562_022812 [Oryza meyeriana var. granulata]